MSNGSKGAPPLCPESFSPSPAAGRPRVDLELGHRSQPSEANHASTTQMAHFPLARGVSNDASNSAAFVQSRVLPLHSLATSMGTNGMGRATQGAPLFLESQTISFMAVELFAVRPKKSDENHAGTWLES